VSTPFELIHLIGRVFPFSSVSDNHKTGNGDTPVRIYPAGMPVRNHVKTPGFRASFVFKTLPGMKVRIFIDFEASEHVFKHCVHGQQEGKEAKHSH
jgi:hypothetical protein